MHAISQDWNAAMRRIQAGPSVLVPCCSMGRCRIRQSSSTSGLTSLQTKPRLKPALPAPETSAQVMSEPGITKTKIRALCEHCNEKPYCNLTSRKYLFTSDYFRCNRYSITT